jgi:cob(I)alamin adenosyltransferase
MKEVNKLKKEYSNLSKESKTQIDNESLKSTETLKKLASKLDLKYLSSKTKDKLDKLQEDLQINSNLSIDGKSSDKVYEAKDIKEFFNALHSNNKQVQKEDSFVLEKEDADKAQNMLINALQEQINKQVTEKTNLKLF